MAKRQPGIRKTLEHLIKKVETLENQSFGQKLLIDELENKLQAAETLIQKIQENPFGLGAVNVPFVQPAPPPLVTQPQYIPNTPLFPWPPHTCTPGNPDWTGGIYCTGCGANMAGPTWTITSTSDGTSFTLADPASQSSSDVEPVLDLDVSWIVPDDFPKKD